MNIYQVFSRAFVFACALLIGTATVAGTRFIVSTVAAVKQPAAITVQQFPLPEPLMNKGVEEVVANTEQEINDEFDPTGSYSLDNEDIPKAFADIEFIEIETREYKAENGKYFNIPVVPSGSINTTRKFTFKKIAVANREIAFETEIVNGISYKFVGQFSDSSEVVNCESCEYPADLQGRLIKIKNGKVVAEWSANFFYEHGC